MYGVGGGNRKRPQSFVGLVEARQGGCLDIPRGMK